MWRYFSSVHNYFYCCMYRCVLGSTMYNNFVFLAYELPLVNSAVYTEASTVVC